MNADVKNTFLGTDFGDDISKKTMKLLGENLELHTPGSDARKTEEKASSTRDHG